MPCNEYSEGVKQILATRVMPEPEGLTTVYELENRVGIEQDGDGRHMTQALPKLMTQTNLLSPNSFRLIRRKWWMVLQPNSHAMLNGTFGNLDSWLQLSSISRSVQAYN